MMMSFKGFFTASILFSLSTAFSIQSPNTKSWTNRKLTTLLKAKQASSERINQVHLEVIASAGVSQHELSDVLSKAESALDSEFGIQFLYDNVTHHDVNPVLSNIIPGAMGRVALISLNNVKDWDENDERLEPFKNIISQEIDSLVGNEIEQPILVSIRPNFSHCNEQNMIDILVSSIEEEVKTYQLRTPLAPDDIGKEDSLVQPCMHVEIDGAAVPDPFTKENVWDTSTILVFDNFVDDSLRKRLLDVVNNRDGNYDWDDKVNGPDPRRWERGGLVDTFDDVSSIPSCWGLTQEAIEDLCLGQHRAISETEAKISQLFPDFIVTRLPEAVLSSCVSPLTGNAPTFGDEFQFHIDADPNQTPPSPWTDVFGRYFNRSRGKPLFVSCLIYLNDEWDGDLGAPTQFYDPPSEEVYEVYPRPGRCVMMDQDITHSVVPPNKAAGKLPRYSLVWKLILHPRKDMQPMKSTSGCPTVCFGSANTVSQ